MLPLWRSSTIRFEEMRFQFLSGATEMPLLVLDRNALPSLPSHHCTQTERINGKCWETKTILTTMDAEKKACKPVRCFLFADKWNIFRGQKLKEIGSITVLQSIVSLCKELVEFLWFLITNNTHCKHIWQSYQILQMIRYTAVQHNRASMLNYPCSLTVNLRRTGSPNYYVFMKTTCGVITCSIMQAFRRAAKHSSAFG